MRLLLAIMLLALLLPAQAVVLAFKDTPGTKRVYVGDLQETLNSHEADLVGPAYLVFRSERVVALDGGVAGLVWEQTLQRKDSKARTEQAPVTFTRTAQGKIAVTPTGVLGEPKSPYVRFDPLGMTLALPTRDLRPGDTWTIKGQAACDGFTLFMLTGDFTLTCRLEEVKSVGKATYAQIATTYTLVCPKQQPSSEGLTMRFSACAATETVKATVLFNATAGEITYLTYRTEIAKTTYDDAQTGRMTVTKRFGTLRK